MTYARKLTCNIVNHFVGIHFRISVLTLLCNNIDPCISLALGHLAVLYYISQCVVIRSVALAMEQQQKWEMPFFDLSLCAFSLTSAIESEHPAGASGVSSHFFHFWVVMGRGCFTQFTLIFFSPRRAISNAIPIIFFLLRRRGCWWDMSSCFNIFFFPSLSESQRNFIIPSSNE